MKRLANIIFQKDGVEQSEEEYWPTALDGSALKDGTLFKINNNKIKNFNIIDWKRNKRNISKNSFPTNFYAQNFS